MDLWAKLLGFEPPEVTVLEAERWISVPMSTKLERALTKRAKKEQWSFPDGFEAFHALAMARQRKMSSLNADTLDIDVCGITVLTLQGAEADPTLERMRVGKSGVVALAARARITDAGSWQVEVSIL